MILAIFIICLAPAFYGCGRQDTSLTEAEGAAITDISGVDFHEFEDVSQAILTRELSSRFPAVSKVHRNENLFAFITEPVAYNGPITLAFVIDSNLRESIGMRIVEHIETPDYVRDMENSWFTDRFAYKSVYEYLRMVRLRAVEEHDVVAITGATVTTEGIINGVNAAIGVYQEYVLGLTAEAVPLMVRFEPGEGDGPMETGSLAFRAYGLILAEVSLEEIRELPSVRRTMSIHSSVGVTQHEFRGTLLSNILDLIDPVLTDEYGWLLAVGVDNYISNIMMDEVMAENNVFIMYEDNGEPLPKLNGEPGAMRLVVLHDIFGQRFTNYLIEIVLEGRTE